MAKKKTCEILVTGPNVFGRPPKVKKTMKAALREAKKINGFVMRVCGKKNTVTSCKAGVCKRIRASKKYLAKMKKAYNV